MVKSEERARAKMERGVRAAGPEIEAGMQDAKDPLDVLLADPKGNAEKMKAGVDEAIRTKKWEKGLEKAKARDSWKGSISRAKAHYTERAADMVDNAMEDYPGRVACIERAQASVKDMPTTTTADRIAKSAAYQLAAHKEFNKLYGRSE